MQRYLCSSMQLISHWWIVDEISSWNYLKSILWQERGPGYGSNYVTQLILYHFVSFPLPEYLEPESGTLSTITIRIHSNFFSGH